MGKAKKRNFNKSRYLSPINLKREQAVENIVYSLNHSQQLAQIKDTITLFGISAEELAESGAQYEHLLALKSVLV